MSFASEPGRDDYDLPPVNVVVPDDARELERDMLAYRRELKSRRRQRWLARIFGPFRSTALGGRAAIIPLIAVCLAVSLVGGALLSVASMNPAAAPTVASPPLPVSGMPAQLPLGSVSRAGKEVAARSLVTSVIALIPASCNCGTSLRRLAGQARAARVHVYFAAGGAAVPQLPSLVSSYGDDTAVAVTDDQKVLSTAFHSAGLTVLLVYKDASAELLRPLTGDFHLTSAMSKLGQPGPSLGHLSPG